MAILGVALILCHQKPIKNWSQILLGATGSPYQGQRHEADQGNGSEGRQHSSQPGVLRKTSPGIRNVHRKKYGDLARI